MSTHDLKIWPEHYEAVMLGLKKAELRLDDRGFRVGDDLELREWDRFGRFYTGRQTTRSVAYVGRGVGLQDGYVALHLVDPDARRRGEFFLQLAQALGAKVAFGQVEEEALLLEVARLKVRAGEHPRLGEVLELIRAAHTTILMGSAPKAKADLGEAARLLAALMDGRA
jgi:hypothetical protein